MTSTPALDSDYECPHCTGEGKIDVRAQDSQSGEMLDCEPCGATGSISGHMLLEIFLQELKGRT